MSLIERYILKRILLMTGLIGTVILLCLWLTQSMRFVDLLSVQKVPFGQFITFLTCIIPDLIALVLPIALIVAIMTVFYKLSQDHELIILRGLRLSDPQIVRSILWLTMCISIVVLYLHLHLSPLAFRNFKSLESRFNEIKPEYLLKPGDFHTYKHLTVFVEAFRNSHELVNLTICDTTYADKQVMMFAERGIIVLAPNVTRLILKNGIRQEWDKDKGNFNHASFEEYSLDLLSSAATTKTRMLKPYERFLPELLFPRDVGEDVHLRRKFQAEGHQKILSAVYLWTMVLGVLNILFKSSPDRRRSKGPMLIGIIFISLVQGIYFGLLHLSVHFPLLLIIAYIVPIVLIIFGRWALHQPWNWLTLRHKLSSKSFAC